MVWKAQFWYKTMPIQTKWYRKDNLRAPKTRGKRFYMKVKKKATSYSTEAVGWNKCLMNFLLDIYAQLIHNVVLENIRCFIGMNIFSRFLKFDQLFPILLGKTLQIRKQKQDSTNI